jgi:hypothetical protein
MSNAPKQKVTPINASAAVEKSKEVAIRAVDTARKTTDEFAGRGANAVKEFWETGSKELRAMQDKAFALSREASKNLSKTSETSARSVSEALEASHSNLEAAKESLNVATDYARKIAEHSYEFANRSIATQLTNAKDLFSCRTLNDVMELQNKNFLAQVDAIFHQSLKLSDMLFKLSTEVVEPLQERATKASERVSKSLLAA